MLDSLTVGDMVEAVASKYGMPPEMIKNVYKKTKKGILVNMDDRMIEQFVDEDDFIINLDFDNQLGHFELTLQYWTIWHHWATCLLSFQCSHSMISNSPFCYIGNESREFVIC